MATLSLDQANHLIAAVFAEAVLRELPPLAVAVLDQGGHLKAMQRQDGLSFLRADICQAKAWGALALGRDSAELASRFIQDAQQQGFLQALSAMSGGRIIPLPGGVLIRDDDGETIGAIGVAGALSEQDEACALAAIRSIGLHATGDEQDD
ncbi:MAG: heme-binding protein [Gammaproteobacteria bacterium]|nr:heme-binding protein [Gammaproteobacteria bacterium]